MCLQAGELFNLMGSQIPRAQILEPMKHVTLVSDPLRTVRTHNEGLRFLITVRLFFISFQPASTPKEGQHASCKQEHQPDYSPETTDLRDW